MEHSKKRSKKRGSFSQQITRRIIRSGILSFVIAVCCIVLVVYPFLRRSAINENDNTNKSIVERIESTLKQAELYSQSLSSAITENTDILAYMRNPSEASKAKAQVALNNLNNYTNNIRALAIVSAGMDMIDSMTNISEEDEALLKSDFISGMSKDTFSQGCSTVYTAHISYNEHLTTAYARNFFINNHWITLVLLIDLNSLRSEIASLAAGKLDIYYLTDSTGEAFIKSGSEEDIRHAEELAETIMTNQYASSNGDLVFVRTSSITRYGIVSYVRLFTILKTLTPYLIGLFFAMGFSMILTIWWTQRSVSAAIKPLLDLSSHMLIAAEGNLDCKVETNRNDEIGLVEKSFNKMIDELDANLKIISQQKENEQKQKFSLLISQIDPHFIYNTINSINYLARRGRTEDIVKVNTALITILRDRLRVNDIQITDSVANEMQVVREYIVIEQFMYGGSLEVEWDLDDDLMEAQIPKNMIQPLVENALFHGLIDEESGELNGRLIIHLHKDETNPANLVLCVEDNGAGMDAERLEEVQREEYDPSSRGKSIGISNIRGRLYYLYGDEEHLSIESTAGKGTKITILFSNIRSDINS